jgi:hypothetical protein
MHVMFEAAVTPHFTDRDVRFPPASVPQLLVTDRPRLMEGDEMSVDEPSRHEEKDSFGDPDATVDSTQVVMMTTEDEQQRRDLTLVVKQKRGSIC